MVETSLPPDVLWSGIIGSVVAAVLGALVALGIVMITNRHQSDLATQARREAAAQADRQLEAQEKGLREQLQAQERGLREQLEEQKRESSRVREIAAIADLLGATRSLVRILREGTEPAEMPIARLESACFRWQVETGDALLREELPGASHHAAMLALDVVYRPSEAATERFLTFLATLQDSAEGWPQADDDERNALVLRLRTSRQENPRTDS